MEEKEIWKDIAGYEGKYQVSNLGNVRSLQYHNAKGIMRIGYLKPAVDNKGYLRCALSKENKLKTFKVHRLVASAFIDNPDNLPQINHKDGNKLNNHVENLEWCNNSQNQLHAYATGLNPRHMPKHHPVIIVDNSNGNVRRFECIKFAAEYIGEKRQTLENRLRTGAKPRFNKKYSCFLEKDYNETRIRK